MRPKRKELSSTVRQPQSDLWSIKTEWISEDITLHSLYSDLALEYRCITKVFFRDKRVLTMKSRVDPPGVSSTPVTPTEHIKQVHKESMIGMMEDAYSYIHDE